MYHGGCGRRHVSGRQLLLACIRSSAVVHIGICNCACTNWFMLVWGCALLHQSARPCLFVCVCMCACLWQQCSVCVLAFAVVGMYGCHCGSRRLRPPSHIKAIAVAACMVVTMVLAGMHHGQRGCAHVRWLLRSRIICCVENKNVLCAMMQWSARAVYVHMVFLFRNDIACTVSFFRSECMCSWLVDGPWTPLCAHTNSGPPRVTVQCCMLYTDLTHQCCHTILSSMCGMCCLLMMSTQLIARIGGSCYYCGP